MCALTIKLYIHKRSSLSDIVRDYTLSSFTSVELQHRQRAFVTTLLITFVRHGADKKIDAVLFEYCVTSISQHIAASAVILPLSNDPDALTWLLAEKSDSRLIMYILNGIPCFEENVCDLAMSLMLLLQ